MDTTKIKILSSSDLVKEVKMKLKKEKVSYPRWDEQRQAVQNEKAEWYKFLLDEHGILTKIRLTSESTNLESDLSQYIYETDIFKNFSINIVQGIRWTKIRDEVVYDPDQADFLATEELIENLINPQLELLAKVHPLYPVWSKREYTLINDIWNKHNPGIQVVTLPINSNGFNKLKQTEKKSGSTYSEPAPRRMTVTNEITAAAAVDGM